MNEEDSQVELNIGRFMPKYLWQKCPNCLGYGSFAHGTKVCPTCGGKGSVQIPVKDAEPVGVNGVTPPDN